jgi:hypothetical protein
MDYFPEDGTPLSALKNEVCDCEVLIEIITAASDFWAFFFPLKREGLPESVISILPFLRFEFGVPTRLMGETSLRRVLKLVC